MLTLLLLFVYFKPEGMSAYNMKSIDLNAVQAQGIYGVFMDASGSNTLYDVSGVKDVRFSSAECTLRSIPTTYADISGIMVELQAFPFKYNNGGQGDIKVLWNLNSGEPDSSRLTDHFGNEVFNSGYNPNAETSGADLSCVPITSNMIKGIKVKTSGSSLVIDESGNDLSYNTILSFITADSTATDISGSITAAATASNFTFNNTTTEKRFVADGIRELEDPSRVLVWVDYSENTFDKMINSGDTVTFEYTPPSNWPTTIKDQYGNFMFDTDGAPVSVTNNMDYSGNLSTATVTNSTGNIINIVCDMDISVNPTDMISGNDTFTFNTDLDPQGVNIDEIMKVDATTMSLTLTKSLYATSLPKLTYTNSGSGIRNTYGIKLNNKTGLAVNVSAIPAPGSDDTWIYNSGKLNEFGILDLSFNPPIDDIGNKVGWKYQASYTQNGSLYTDLSTNGFVNISDDNVSIDNGIITLDTKFNSSGGVRGFSKEHTSGGNYSIKVKYEGDLSSNRPSGPLGYLPDFDLEMADASNNILDPSCNFDQSSKKTAIVLNANPNKVLTAMQQPINDDGITFHDISNITFEGEEVIVFSDGVLNYNSTNVSLVSGIAAGGHTVNTKWIQSTHATDISSSTKYINWGGGGSGGKTIRDQNGGVLQYFSLLPITSYVNWTELTTVGGWY